MFSIKQWRTTRCSYRLLGIFSHKYVHITSGYDVCNCGMQRECPGVLECHGAHIAYMSEQLIKMSNTKEGLTRYEQ